MALQFSLWGIFRQLGEGDGGGEQLDGGDEEGEIPMTKMVNLAKLYGNLVGEGALSLHILKVCGCSIELLTNGMELNSYWPTVFRFSTWHTYKNARKCS